MEGRLCDDIRGLEGVIAPPIGYDVKRRRTERIPVQRHKVLEGEDDEGSATVGVATDVERGHAHHVIVVRGGVELCDDARQDIRSKVLALHEAEHPRCVFATLLNIICNKGTDYKNKKKNDKKQ